MSKYVKDLAIINSYLANTPLKEIKSIHKRGFNYIYKTLKKYKIKTNRIKKTNGKFSRNKHEYYRIWLSMKQRCYNENSKPYENYGERGIKVCERWLTDFYNFVEDMGTRPKGYTLERIDNNKNYSPDNCKWATYSEQQANKRKNKKASSLHKYIHYCNRSNRWVLRKNKKHLGSFKTELEAVNHKLLMEVRCHAM